MNIHKINIIELEVLFDYETRADIPRGLFNKVGVSFKSLNTPNAYTKIFCKEDARDYTQEFLKSYSGCDFIKNAFGFSPAELPKEMNRIDDINQLSIESYYKQKSNHKQY